MKKLLWERKENELLVSTDSLKEQSVHINKMIHRIDSANDLVSLQLKNMVTEKVDSSNFQYYSIQDCVDQAIEHFPFEYPQQRQLIHCDIQKDFQFCGEMTLTKHVIWNLMANALYFIKEVDKGQINISTVINDQHNILRFCDTARGMTSDEAKQVFERYYTNRTDGNGSGVGLSFCKLVMTAYGGSIVCNAELGEFTEFLLYFPKPS
ncbi:MAG: GHKL domain-containing protein [Legionellales bacterium]|nr:GHKL domain-containing protein [Legionellales bacterium]